MRRNILPITTVAAAFVLVATWLSPVFPATLPPGAATPPGGELTDLALLHAALRQRASEQIVSLDSTCEFGLIRDRLAQVRDEAVDAVRRIGELWRAGRLRAGGFAFSEVLVHDFAALVTEVIWSIAAADALAMLEAVTPQISDAEDVAARITAIHPPAAACVAGRPKPTPTESALAR